MSELFENTEPGELHGKLDAILRDPDVTGDVRATVTQILALDSYLSTHEFQADDNGYVTSVLKPDAAAATAPDDAAAAAAAASSREAEQDAEIARLRAELDAERAGNAAPVTAEPVTTEPVTTEPVATEPVATEPPPGAASEDTQTSTAPGEQVPGAGEGA